MIIALLSLLTKPYKIDINDLLSTLLHNTITDEVRPKDFDLIFLIIPMPTTFVREIFVQANVSKVSS